MQIDIFRDGVCLGNFSPDDTPQLLHSGRLLPTDLVRRDGGMIPLAAILNCGSRRGESAPPRTEYGELQIYEKLRIALESPMREFLKPYQIGADSSSELNLLRMDDFFAGFVSSANKFTDACCQSLVKVIRSSSVSSAIRETATPELAKRVRETSFKKLDELLGAVAGTAKKIEVLHGNIEKLKEEIKAVVAATPALVAQAVTAPVLAETMSGLATAYSFGMHPKWKSRTEELGTQSIEGVDAEGTRTITTIPAGAIGNERPIEITYEKWYSRDLQLVVMSRHNDPRFGEQTYRLTNIVRSEPDPSLFTLPSGYRLITEPSGTYTISPKASITYEKATKAAPAAGAPKGTRP